MYEEEEKDEAKFALPCKLWEGGLHLTGGLAGPGHNGLHTLLQLTGIVKIREGGPLGKERRRREGGRGGKEGEKGRRERREGGRGGIEGKLKESGWILTLHHWPL